MRAIARKRGAATGLALLAGGLMRAQAKTLELWKLGYHGAMK